MQREEQVGVPVDHHHQAQPGLGVLVSVPRVVGVDCDVGNSAQPAGPTEDALGVQSY